MKSLFFSDLHCHNYEQFSERLPNGRNSRFQDCLDIIEQARILSIEHGVDYCFFLGDLFHSRTKLDIDVFSSTFDSMERLSQSVPVIMLVGNHDQYTKVGEIHSITAFKKIAKVIDQPEILELSGRYPVACYPHTSDVEGMKEWIKQMPPVDLFLFHQGISEAAVGPHDMHVKTEIGLNDLPFDKSTLLIAGDYHKRQFLRGGRFHYCGSPLQLSFGEAGDEKCFSLIDSEGWTTTSIATEAPRFFSFNSVEEYEKAKATIREKDFVKVEDSKRIELEGLKQSNPRVQIQLKKEEVTKSQRLHSQAMDDQSLLQAWLEENKASFPNLDKDELLEEGMSILQSANEAE